jgi:hypothetical protein
MYAFKTLSLEPNTQFRGMEQTVLPFEGTSSRFSQLVNFSGGAGRTHRMFASCIASYSCHWIAFGAEAYF